MWRVGEDATAILIDLQVGMRATVGSAVAIRRGLAGNTSDERRDRTSRQIFLDEFANSAVVGIGSFAWHKCLWLRDRNSDREYHTSEKKRALYLNTFLHSLNIAMSCILTH